MNNKGVTLVELIIVIVIIGIISAFTVPAVGRYLETAQKSAVYEDAVQIRNAADNYCAEKLCADGTIYVFDGTAATGETDLSGVDLLSNFDAAAYTSAKATKTASGWNVEIVAAADEFQWQSADPIGLSADDVDEDPA